MNAICGVGVPCSRRRVQARQSASYCSLNVQGVALAPPVRRARRPAHNTVARAGGELHVVVGTARVAVPRPVEDAHAAVRARRADRGGVRQRAVESVHGRPRVAHEVAGGSRSCATVSGAINCAPPIAHPGGSQFIATAIVAHLDAQSVQVETHRGIEVADAQRERILLDRVEIVLDARDGMKVLPRRDRRGRNRTVAVHVEGKLRAAPTVAGLLEGALVDRDAVPMPFLETLEPQRLLRFKSHGEVAEEMVEAVVARHADVLHPHEVPASVRHPVHADRDHAARPVELHEVRHGIRRVRAEVVQVRVRLVRGESAVEIVFERNHPRRRKLALPDASLSDEFLERKVLHRVEVALLANVHLRRHAVVRDAHETIFDVERVEACIGRAYDHAAALHRRARRRIRERHRIGSFSVCDQYGHLGLALQAHAIRAEVHARGFHALRRSHAARRTGEHGLRAVFPRAHLPRFIHPVLPRAAPRVAILAVPSQRLGPRANRPRAQPCAPDSSNHVFDLVVSESPIHACNLSSMSVPIRLPISYTRRMRSGSWQTRDIGNGSGGETSSAAPAATRSSM